MRISSGFKWDDSVQFNCSPPLLFKTNKMWWGTEEEEEEWSTTIPMGRVRQRIDDHLQRQRPRSIHRFRRGQRERDLWWSTHQWSHRNLRDSLPPNSRTRSSSSLRNDDRGYALLPIPSHPTQWWLLPFAVKYFSPQQGVDNFLDTWINTIPMAMERVS